MKKFMKKSASFLLAAVMVLSGVLFAPQDSQKAEAAAKYSISNLDKNITMYYEPDCYHGAWYTDVYINGATKANQIAGVSSSKSSVVKVVRKQGFVRVYYYKKGGSANITVKMTNKQKLTFKVNVKKYTSPVASLKIGTKQFASNFKGASDYEYFHTGLKKKTLSIKAKAGWTIERVYVYRSSAGSVTKYPGKASYSLKNMSFTGGYDNVNVIFKNSKTKQYTMVELNLVKE